MTESTDPALYTLLLAHFARYFDACDRFDIDEVMEIMAGATVGAGDSAMTEPSDIRAMYESRQPPPRPDGRRVTKHHITNLLVEGPDTDGAIRASVYYFRLEPGDSGPVVAASGRLSEIVVREGQRFRVLSHTIVSDF